MSFPKSFFAFLFCLVALPSAPVFAGQEVVLLHFQKITYLSQDGIFWGYSWWKTVEVWLQDPQKKITPFTVEGTDSGEWTTNNETREQFLPVDHVMEIPTSFSKGWKLVVGFETSYQDLDDINTAFFLRQSVTPSLEIAISDLHCPSDSAAVKTAENKNIRLTYTCQKMSDADSTTQR